jgi:type IV secretory pathway TrbD component
MAVGDDQSHHRRLLLYPSHLATQLVLAALLIWPVQWLIRLLSKHDAQFFEVYRRAIRHPLIREPN